mmetsp:Transcript_18312/g.27675  ORF Transcript_18312/g.27675 Transcript_18312/m.27675 type:complete len:130 (+) Transcript_18312:415-804(+)
MATHFESSNRKIQNRSSKANGSFLRRKSCPSLLTNGNKKSDGTNHEKRLSCRQRYVMLQQRKKAEDQTFHNESSQCDQVVVSSNKKYTRRVSTDLFEELRERGVNKLEATLRQRRLSKLKRAIGYFDDE